MGREIAALTLATSPTAELKQGQAPAGYMETKTQEVLEQMKAEDEFA